MITKEKRFWRLDFCKSSGQKHHIFLLFLGFHPKPILFNLPAAALEVTSVQIYTLYHGWHVVCVSVYPKPLFQLPLADNLWFFPSVYHRLLGIELLHMELCYYFLFLFLSSAIMFWRTNEKSRCNTCIKKYTEKGRWELKGCGGCGIQEIRIHDDLIRDLVKCGLWYLYISFVK